MAHELFFENGKASMFYVDEVPWHKHGTRLERPPATSAEAIEAANLNWEVMKAPIYVSGTGRLIPVEDRFAVLRRDLLDRADCSPFGLVGRDYVPLQNRQAFEFFDPLLKEGEVTFETAGALGQGERIWVLARFGDDVKIGPDELKRYLLLSNRHDGSGKVTIKFTPIRVVCQNTLSAALHRDNRAFQIRHDRQMYEQLDATRALIAMIRSTYRELQGAFEDLQQQAVQDSVLSEYLAEVFPAPKKQNDQPRLERVLKDRRAAWHFFHHGRGNAANGVRGTFWAAYNGVTEYIDHRKPNAVASDFNDARLRYVWFGGGAAVKERALVAALRRVAPHRLGKLGLESA